MKRPSLSKNLSESDFLKWYWLKSELALFCKESGLPTSGAKLQLLQRVAAHLSGRPQVKTVAPKKKADTMPMVFDTNTMIGEGWRFTKRLRDFFESECGKGFRFNGAVRNFIATGAGKSLEEALVAYRKSLLEPPRDIGIQFEFNRHMREFKESNPNASHIEAVSAWWEKRGTPKV